MPPTRYDVHLATALDPVTLRATPSALPRIHQLSKPYSYVDQMQRRSRSRASRLPALLRRPAGWLDFGMRLLRNTGYTTLLSRWVKRDGFALIHLNNGFENIEADLAAWLARRPIVVHAHGPCGNARLTRKLAARGPVCIAISDVVGRSLIDAGVAPERVHVLPNPLTLDPLPLDATLRHSARRELGIPDRFRLMGIVGRIVEWKGQREFLNAAAVAMKSDPHLGAVIIGDVTDAMDEYGNQVRKQVADLGLADRVWFSGFMPDPRQVYALADVVVHSSILPEPFGLVITEAMALGIPVVAANAGGPVEIITDGVDGFLVDPRDSATVAARVSALLADPALYQRIGAAGRRTALERFSPEAYVERVARVYDAALAGSNTR